MRSRTARVLQAALLDTGKLNRLLSEAAQHRMTTLVLRSTGAGTALGTGWIWQSMGPAAQRKRADTLRRWRNDIKAEVDACRAKWGKAKIPGGQVKSLLLNSGWKAHLMDLRRLLEMLSTGPHESQECATLAVLFVIQGFRSVDELEGLQPAAVAKLTPNPKEQALLL